MSIPLNSAELKFLATFIGMIPSFQTPPIPPWESFAIDMAQQIVGRLAGSVGLALPPGASAVPPVELELPAEEEMTPDGIERFCARKSGDFPPTTAVAPGTFDSGFNMGTDR